MSTTAIAARPHGGGGDTALGANDLVLIDCGGTLHNYWSDLTRVRIEPTPCDFSCDLRPHYTRHSLFLRPLSPNDNLRFGMPSETLKLRPWRLPEMDLTPGSLTRPLE